ncbi:MAG: diguanylate cyclase domain-containing protein [Oscillospiraceae bacterium]
MKKSTLKFGLVGVMLIFVIIPTLIAGVVGTLVTVNYSKGVSVSELSAVSLSKSGSLDAVFSGYINSAKSLSTMTAVIESFEKNNGAGAAELEAFVEGRSDIIDGLLVNKKGAVIASSRKVQTGNFQHFDENGLSSVSGLLTWENYESSEQDAIYVSHKVKSYDGKIDLGYVVFIVSLSGDSNIGRALSGSYVGNHANLALVDSVGNTVNFAGDGSIMKAAQVDSAFANTVSAIFSSTSSTGGLNNAQKVFNAKAGKYTIAYGAIPDINSWRWVGVVRTADITEFASTTNMIIWIVVAAVCLLCAAVAFVIATRFVSKMQKLIKTMNDINLEEVGGSFHIDVKHDKSELGMIQKSFNDFITEVYMNGERYKTIAALSDSMLFEWDFHKERMYASDNLLAKFDINLSAATPSNGRFLDSLMTQEFADKYKRDINTLLKNQGSYSAEYKLKSKTGSDVWVSCKATCVSDRLGEPLRVIGVLNDIDNEKKLEVQLSERASVDFLSQLNNRTTFIKKLTTVLDRRGPHKIGVMFIDVDDFKFINDRYGHAIGDEVIRFVADTIRKKVDDRGGFAGRFGGDEFMLCFTNQEDVENLEQIAMDIIDELYVGYTNETGTLINVRASIGISYCPTHTTDVNELISFSDTAMYFVKKNGKTNYHVYVPEDSESGEYVDPEGY